MKFLLLLLNLLLLIVIVKSASTTLRIAVLSDPRITTLSTIDTELVPTLKNLTLDYLLVTGSFIADDVTDTNVTADTIQNMKIFFTKLAPVVSKLIFWVPGELDGIEVNNFTHNDVNVYNTVLNVVPGLYVSGMGELQGSTEMDFSKLDNLINQLNKSASVLLLTNKGPAGFSTSLRRSNVESIDVAQLLDQSLWNTTGNQNLTSFLGDAGVQQHVVMNVHGGNPQGIGDSSFGNIRIINPGSTYFTQSLVMTEFIKNQLGSWVLNNWKFYRFGNITAWSPNPLGYKTSVVDTCQMTTVQVAAPYVNEIYSEISIALYAFGILAIVILLLVWVVYSLKSEQV